MNRVACVNIWLMQWSQVKSDLCVSFLSMHCQGWTRWLVSAFPLLVKKPNRLKGPVITLRNAKFNIHNFYVPSTPCINVSYNSQTNSNCLPIHGFHNRGGVCLLRGRSCFYKFNSESYVYGTVHHVDSWVKGNQLDVTCFIISLFNAQHVSDVNTSILGSLRLICWVISWVVLLWFDVCWCYVVVWLWWCGIRM